MKSRRWRVPLTLLAIGALALLILSSPVRHRPTLGAGQVGSPSPGPSPKATLKIQKVSSDPFTNPGSQHATEVEPDTFAFGDTVVATFQAGRFDRGGGASAIGFATSTDRGQTWISGFLPNLTVFSTPPGPSSRASDASVAYDALHEVWLIASLRCPPPPKGCETGPTQLVIHRSRDGLLWTGPVVASSGDYDKSWIVCDNGRSSEFKGRCYASWTDVRRRRTLTSSTVDGGLTWSRPTTGDRMLGAQPVVQPNGTLVITGEDERARRIIAIRSMDGGRTFEHSVLIARFQRSNRRGFRTEQLPSSEADGVGTVYVAWHDCRFNPGCRANDIVLSSSTDGRVWSRPRRIPLRGSNSGADAVLPGLGVDPATSGRQARLGVTFYSFERVPCSVATCRLNVGFVSSNDAGETWTDVIPLNLEPIPLLSLPKTNLGRMAGDYISTSFVEGSAVTVFPVAGMAGPASPNPSGSGPAFDQAMYAATIPD
jgi:hypothetical protein